MNKVVVGVLVAVIVGLGVWALVSKTVTPNTEQATEGIFEASFSCADDTHFVAEFHPEAEKVEIRVRGVLARTLPRVVGAGQRFEDTAYVYVFAGEGVSVTTKATNQTTTCTQPVDMNNAPVNFGDMGEGAGGSQNIAAAVNENIIGTYKSHHNALFVREFTAEGTVIDTYNNEQIATGTWKVFTAEQPLSVSFPLTAGNVYVQLSLSGKRSETLNFRIGQLTPQTLELIYMERNGTVIFDKVK